MGGQAFLAGLCRSATCNDLRLARGPYVQDLASDRAIIRWTTTKDCVGEVEIGTPDTSSYRVGARTSVIEPWLTGLDATFYEHRAAVAPLQESSEYHYRLLGSGFDLTPEGECRIKTSGAGRFSFLVFGDSGAGTPEQAALAALMSGGTPDLVLHTGDLVCPAGSFQAYERNYFAFYRSLMQKAPFFPCLGNHDIALDKGAAYLAVHSLPDAGAPESDRGRYYSFDWGAVHFIALDSFLSLFKAAEGSSRMLEWLHEDLRNTRQPWRIAFFHHPPFASGRHEGSLECGLSRTLLAPILEQYGVQLVLNGHEHSYQRTLPLRDGVRLDPGNGAIYITTGGGGADLYEAPLRPFLAMTASEYHYLRVTIDGGRLEVEAIRVSGETLDKAGIELNQGKGTGRGPCRHGNGIMQERCRE